MGGGFVLGVSMAGSGCDTLEVLRFGSFDLLTTRSFGYEGTCKCVHGCDAAVTNPEKLGLARGVACARSIAESLT